MSHNSKNHAQECWPILPVRAVEVYRNDVVVRYAGRSGGPGSGGGIRGNVDELSRQSLQKLAFYASNTAVDFRSMLTLTYPGRYETDGAAVKRHLNRFLSWARAYWDGLSYLWFLEFQKRGAPHFHLLLSVEYDPRDIPTISQRWYDAVGSGDIRHLRAGTRFERIRTKDGARRYAIKYATKPEQKTIPVDYRSVGRFWGSSRDVKPAPVAEYETDRPGVMRALQTWDRVDLLQDRNLSTLYNAAGAFGVLPPVDETGK